MIFLILFLVSVFVALGTGVLAGISDFKGMTIPNLYQVVIVGSFVTGYGAAYFAGVDIVDPLWKHFAAALVLFGITFGMFALKLIGGGDSKLVTTYALWTSFGGLAPLLFYMAFTGAFLGVAALVIQKRKPFANPPEASWVGRVQAGESRVPYGIPIAFGALIAFINCGYLSPETFRMFLAG